MNKPVRIDDIASHLRLISEITNNEAAAREAKRLILRLNSPVRVVLFGLPGSGKLDTLNALCPGPDLPAPARSVTVELRYGRVEASEITFSDGSVAQHDGPLEAEDLAEAAMVVVERPLEALRKTSFMNIVASADAGEQRAAISWAARRTDIALWCSTRFGPTDQAIWARVPEQVKNHGYLVLTGCDIERAADIKARFLDEFRDVYSVDFASPGATGIADLAGRIARDAAVGRQEDLDSALLFLKSQLPRERTPTRPRSRPVEQVPPPDIVLAAEAEAEAEAEAVPAPAPVTETATLTRRSAPKPAVLGTGFGYLRDRGLALLRAVEAPDGLSERDILAHCGDTLTHLSDLLLSQDDDDDQALTAELSETVMEAESLVVLLGSEGADDAALEAVSILLQVRRDFEASLAA